MGRKIWIVGVLAALLFTASALTGYGVEQGEGFRSHLLLSLAAGMLVVFCHLWVLLYLFLTGRLISRTVEEEGLEEDLSRSAARRLRRVLPLLVAALVAAVAVIALGDRVYTGLLSPGVHQALAWAALALQAAALAVERGVLDRHEALLADLGRRAG